MKAAEIWWVPERGWSSGHQGPEDADLVLLFAGRHTLTSSTCIAELKGRFPKARLVGCSTSGQIFGGDVCDDRAAALVLKFASTRISLACVSIDERSASFGAGRSVASKLAGSDLRGIFVLSDGLRVNGSELIAGLRSVVGDGVVLTGGLAGDGVDFGATVVVADDVPREGQIAAVGFYGDALVLGHGSVGGWDEFGPKRTVTKSNGNVLSQLDGAPALELYKRYLGDEAEGLPGTALLYPLLLTDPSNHAHSVVRTILAVDDIANTMTFAGDVPEGWTAQLMRGNFDRLAAGAGQAASDAILPHACAKSDVAAIMVSCVGRRILMGEHIVEEVHAATSAMGTGTRTIGYYSYGEISPHAVTGVCELHNQTMTVTTFSEAM